MVRTYVPGEEVIEGYQLTGFLGRGGFGEVWQATGPGGTEVAVKVINISERAGKKELRSLEIVKKVRHPNLVPILGFWLRDENGNVINDSEQADQPEHSDTYLKREATELIMIMGLGDISLHDRLKQCLQANKPGIPVEELLDYMEDSAKAIDHLNSLKHDLGSGPMSIQHCDIKPQNIMIVGGAAQVCDFGLARSMGDVRHTTMAGSPAYAAPECLEENQPSDSTDQYSLAVSYIELRTGRLPFLEDSLMAVFQAHCNGTLDLAELSYQEQLVIRKATRRDPDKRYPSCLAMVRDLRRASEERLSDEFVQELDPENKLKLAEIGKRSRSFNQPSDSSKANSIQQTEPYTSQETPANQEVPTTKPLHAQLTTPALRKTREQHRRMTSLLGLAAIPACLLLAAGLFILFTFSASSTQTKEVSPSKNKLSRNDLPSAAPVKVWLPDGFEQAETAKQITIKGLSYFDRIQRKTPSGETVFFQLIRKANPDDPETFYMSEQKIWNAVFADFVKDSPDQLMNSDWQKGGMARGTDLGIQNGKLPVMRVSVEEAYACCEWLGGRLPSARQWDKAAGLFDYQQQKPKLTGPFLIDWNSNSKTEIAVGRAVEGPLEVGQASHDVSLFSCHDMAGNGSEWTRTLAGGDRRSVPIEDPTGDEAIITRGRSYFQPTPLTYAMLADPSGTEIENILYSTRDPTIGFRCVIELAP